MIFDIISEILRQILEFLFDYWFQDTSPSEEIKEPEKEEIKKESKEPEKEEIKKESKEPEKEEIKKEINRISFAKIGTGSGYEISTPSKSVLELKQRLDLEGEARLTLEKEARLNSLLDNPSQERVMQEQERLDYFKNKKLESEKDPLIVEAIKHEAIMNNVNEEEEITVYSTFSYNGPYGEGRVNEEEEEITVYPTFNNFRNYVPYEDEDKDKEITVYPTFNIRNNSDTNNSQMNEEK